MVDTKLCCLADTWFDCIICNKKQCTTCVAEQWHAYPYKSGNSSPVEGGDTCEKCYFKYFQLPYLGILV